MHNIVTLIASQWAVNFIESLFLNKGETITRVNGDVSMNCSKRLQIE
jgi:hypothetical protein